MRYVRMPIEVESPEEYGYGKHPLQSLRKLDRRPRRFSASASTIPDLTLLYGEHRGSEALRR